MQQLTSFLGAYQLLSIVDFGRYLGRNFCFAHCRCNLQAGSKQQHAEHEEGHEGASHCCACRCGAAI
jgi:hypothetical protein